MCWKYLLNYTINLVKISQNTENKNHYRKNYPHNGFRNSNYLLTDTVVACMLSTPVAEIDFIP